LLGRHSVASLWQPRDCLVCVRRRKVPSLRALGRQAKAAKAREESVVENRWSILTTLGLKVIASPANDINQGQPATARRP
jgi:hypothetical protein